MKRTYPYDYYPANEEGYNPPYGESSRPTYRPRLDVSFPSSNGDYGLSYGQGASPPYQYSPTLQVPPPMPMAVPAPVPPPQPAPPDNPTDLGRYFTTDYINQATFCGRGGYATVFRLDHPVLGCVALKRPVYPGALGAHSDERRRARREARIWSELAHPNVLPFKGIFEFCDDVYFVSPYAVNGPLNKYLRANPSVNQKPLITQVASALAYLHGRGIIHGDVKAANVLVAGDGNALLCDFGLTRSATNETSSAVRGNGSLRWMSPELHSNGQGKTFASDVWAFGMLIYEILSGQHPYHELRTDFLVIRAILVDGKVPPTEPTSALDGTSFDLEWSIASECWNVDPTGRPTMTDVRDRMPQETAAVSSDGDNSNPNSPTFTNAFKFLVLRGYTGGLNSVAFSPDSRILASASAGHTIRLWDPAQGIPICELPMLHKNSVHDISFSSSGATLVSCSQDHTVRLWDVNTRTPIGSAIEARRDTVRTVAFSPEETVFACGSRGGNVRIRDTRQKKAVSVLKGHSGSVDSVCFAPDGRSLASGSADGDIRLWDTRSKQSRVMKGHDNGVWSVGFSPDGKSLVSGSWDKTVRLWDTESLAQTGDSLRGYSLYVLSVAYSPSGRTVASGGSGGIVKLWDVTSSGVPTPEDLDRHGDSTYSVAFSPNGRWLASGSWDKTVRLWTIPETI